jgi:hypothetical protein
LDSDLFEAFPDYIACLRIDVLHTAFRQVEFGEKCIVREDCEYIGQRIAYAKYGFHLNGVILFVWLQT